MTRFLEDPTPAILIGLSALALTVFLYLQTRKTGAFIAIVVVLLLTVAAVLLEQIVVTQREQVETVVYDIAEAAEADDMPGVLAYISPGASEIRRLVELEMPRTKIERARILGKLTITVDETAIPAIAHVKCQCFISGKWGRDQLGFGQRSDIEVFLERANDGWHITEAKGIKR